MTTLVVRSHACGPAASRRHRFLLSALALVTATVAVTGCAEPRKFQPPMDTAALDDTLFLHYLATVPCVTVEEAARAILVLADGEDRFDTYPQRVAELERRDVMRAAWKLEPRNNLDRGTLGYMLFKTCDVPPSVNTLAFGSWGLGDRRYAMQQAAAAGLIEYGPDYQPVTGGEFVAAIARADTYMTERGSTETLEPGINRPANLRADEPIR